MESAAVRLYFLLEHNYSLVTMSCILHIIWVNSCTRNKINFSKDNIARGLCTLVLFISFLYSTIFYRICFCCLLSASSYVYPIAVSFKKRLFIFV